MKTLLAALFAVVTLSCSTTSIQRNTRVPETVEYVPTPDESEESIIGHQLEAGQISEEEALASLENINPKLFSPELKEKFFPIDIITECTIIGTHDENWQNCAYEEKYGWNIECDVSGFEFVKCRIAITCPIRRSPFYGTWVFIKNCDGKPIGTWTLNGLYVNYDTMQRIW